MPESEEEVQHEPDLSRVFPPFKKWRQVYAFVLLWLALLIAIFYLFTRYFAA